ncbi:hypothetical protein VTO42DRAFT_2414 [Malbranchea cinnamomea]
MAFEPSNQVIDVDEELERDDDQDSTYGSEVGSITGTLHSDMMKYRFEHGRRYLDRDGPDYFFPNDEIEQDRLDIIHHMTDLVLEGRLFLAPIDSNPHRILDLGTGTGIWAIDVGDMYPSAEVLGNDLSPIQPNMVPQNVIFEVDDMEEEWTYSTPFDFIHGRYLATAIRDWPRLMLQTFIHLRPGGWAEFCDYDFRYKCDDGTLTPDLAMVQNDILVIEAADRLGRTACPGPHLKGWMEQAGFTNITEKCYKLPIGPWPRDPRMKEIGSWNQLQFLQGAEAWSMTLLMQAYGWTAEQVQAQVAQVRNDAQNMRIHAYYLMYVVYGQKPGP